MRYIISIFVLFYLSAPITALAEDPIKNAMSAAPSSISAKAAVLDWDFKVIREGSNGWTCLPDRANTPGNDPWCITDSWLNFLRAYVNKTKPTYQDIGFAYMLMGDTPVSNIDPYETNATGKDDWVTDLGAHLMILVPDLSMLKNISTDHLNGGPWIMWPDTAYAHIMIPLESRGKTDIQ
ncbi:MAG: hypothetical protein KAQ91_09410 [Methylococcales bacterium]|nr:hypothetical protein [Methylococcales bacterium]